MWAMGPGPGLVDAGCHQDIYYYIYVIYRITYYITY